MTRSRSRIRRLWSPLACGAIGVRWTTLGWRARRRNWRVWSLIVSSSAKIRGKETAGMVGRRRRRRKGRLSRRVRLAARRPLGFARGKLQGAADAGGDDPREHGGGGAGSAWVFGPGHLG